MFFFLLNVDVIGRMDVNKIGVSIEKLEIEHSTKRKNLLHLIEMHEPHIIQAYEHT